MSREYFKQARFAQFRFRGKDTVKSHEEAYLESKQVDKFAGMKPVGRRNVWLDERKEVDVFGQCWNPDCLSCWLWEKVKWPTRLQCPQCEGEIQVLTVDRIPYEGE